VSRDAETTANRPHAGKSPLPTTRFHLAGCSTAATIRGTLLGAAEPRTLKSRSPPRGWAMNVRPRPWEAALGRDNPAWKSPASPRRWCGQPTGDCGYPAVAVTLVGARSSDRPADTARAPWCDTQRCCPGPVAPPRGHAGGPCRCAARARETRHPSRLRRGPGSRQSNSQTRVKVVCCYSPPPRLDLGVAPETDPHRAPVGISEGGRGIIPRDQQAPVECLVRFPWDPRPLVTPSRPLSRSRRPLALRASYRARRRASHDARTK
jgi:hypothetical protein